MILTDYDIIAKESQLEVLDYVIESAKFEIANGNDSYMAVYEAATDQADKSNDNWFAKIANKIKIFVKSAIAKLKMVLNQLATKFRTRKAVKIQKKLSSGKFDKKAASTKDTSFDITNAISIMNSMENALADKTTSACMKFSDAIRNGSIPKSKDDFKTSYLGITKNVGNIPNEVQFTDAKKFIDNAVKYLTNLSKSTADIKKCNDTLKQSGKSASEIRYGISTMFNFLTAYVKEYYENAMKVSKYFMSNGVDSQNSAAAADDTASGASSEETAASVEKTFDELKKMNEQFADKLDINTDELSKLAEDYKKRAAEEIKTSAQTPKESSRPGFKALPQSTDRSYRAGDPGINALNNYIKRIRTVFYKKLVQAKNKDEVDSVLDLLKKAESQYVALIHREFDGKISQKYIDMLIANMRFSEFSSIRNSGEFLKDSMDAGDFFNPKIASDNVESLNDIRRFIKNAKKYSPKAKAAVKEKGITICNKTIRDIRKKHGGNPDLDNIPRKDADKYEFAFELRKQLKDL